MPPRSFVLALPLLWLPFVVASADDADVTRLRQQIATDRGVAAIIGLPVDPADVCALAAQTELTIYLQSADADEVSAMRKAAADAGLLGTRVFVGDGPLDSLGLGDNVVDAVIVADGVAARVPESELLRVMRPRAAAHVGGRAVVKPVPDGIDEWSHPFHGPDNNPQSTDQYVKGDFHTQFVAAPMFSPMPEQSVAAGGRIYKAMGHIAHKANQNEWLNTLLCINAYNGTILWRRDLPEGFMIHRNTMIATDDALLMGDHESCKVFDGVTGEIREQITVPEDITDGPVWKWMGMKNGVLYALVGNPEIQVDTEASARRGLGHWPWGMWKGHDYSDPRTAFGYGRTLVAIDLETKELLWHYRDEEFLDARAVCMNADGKIFCFCPEKFLLCVDAKTGNVVWRSTDEELLTALGPNSKAQHYITGYATTSYMKCNNDYLFFAGPQREQMVVASAINGRLAWTNPTGNLQLVLRDDAVFAAGPQNGDNGMKLDYNTGSILAEFPARRACTRATGCIDSIFYRANGGTVRVLTETNTATHIAPMRPPCQDGVIISNGHLYWGPWMCGCQLSLYGNIGLGPAVTSDEPAPGALRREPNFLQVAKLISYDGDWTSYRGGNDRLDTTDNPVASAGVEPAWSVDVCSADLPTAPVVAGGLVFIADRAGAVQAFTTEGDHVWTAYTGGPVYYAPAVAADRVFVGSADGRVYAFEATSGRRLWSYRVAPQERRIPIFGKLISRWPVAGGVVVQDGAVYAAAGITHYDGTYVVALDAVTGEVKARNDSSGVVSPEVNNGISLQGNLSIVDGELRFLAGGVYETARYDLETLKCLNEPKVQVTSQYRTAFYPYYPTYGKYLSLDYTCEDGCTLSHDASYEGSLFTNLALQAALPPGTPRDEKEAARWARRGQNAPKPENIWQDTANRRFTSFVVSDDRLLVAGHPDEAPEQAFLAAMTIEDGKDAWLQPLPANAVKGGAAVDGTGRIFVSLENGRLMCFKPATK